MDQQDIRTLKILEEIDQREAPSQRHLARELNISLGLVNSFIKRLAHKGYFKITTIPSNRVKYILTPKGIAEKTRLTYDYIRFSFDFYRIARQKLRLLLQSLAGKGVSRIALFGATDLAEIAFLSLQETAITMVAMVDDLKAGQRFLDFEVQDPDSLKTIDYDRILITTVDRTTEEVSDLLRQLNIAEDRIVSL
jgi:DNA-binding MarR family transcriptional regulator